MAVSYTHLDVYKRQKKKYSEFLGFKIKVHPKGRKWTVESHVCDKALCRQKEALIEQAKKVAKPPQHSTESYEIHLYNAKVVGAQSYYKIATHINLDFNGLKMCIRDSVCPAGAVPCSRSVN